MLGGQNPDIASLIRATLTASFASFGIGFTVETRVVFGQHVLEK
jgi:hypothetical protein